MEKIKENYDILIIGGGINGAGIALDAALRGYSVLLLEKDDFGSYTTSGSTKLIHGGLRYLEYMEFSLVRESLREREILLQNAPHLVKPLQVDFPLYKHSERGPIIIKMGMILYDLLSYDKSMPNHKVIFTKNGVGLSEFYGYLHSKGLKGIASYYDCQIKYPEKLCLDTILAAEREGADVLNYSKFVGMELENGFYSIKFNDLIENKELATKAKVVINTTGPFVDEVNKLVSDKIPRLMGGTKGSHILIRKFEGGPENGLYIEAIQDGRPFFIIPWDEYYLVGTTDIFYDDDLNRVTATEDEISYLLKELNYFIKTEDFTRDDILYTYSGIRPLPYEPNKSERQVTRKHIIRDHEKEGLKNYYSIVGGKLTTFRSLAEDTIDYIDKKNGLKNECKTKNYKFINERENNLIIELLSEKYEISNDVVSSLYQYYGDKLVDVLKLIDNDNTLKEKISPFNIDINAQIVYAVINEKAKTLKDIILRRTSLGTHEDLGYNCVEKVAEIAAELLAWSEERKIKEIDNYKKSVKYYYNINNKFIYERSETNVNT
ncbi:MAG: glycerol-3-phosphate dehydrogenase/oxidase [Bacteroidota bacterium]